MQRAGTWAGSTMLAAMTLACIGRPPRVSLCGLSIQSGVQPFGRPSKNHTVSMPPLSRPRKGGGGERSGSMASPADRLLTQFVRQDIAATSARPQDSQTRQFKPTERDMIRRRTLFGSALADPVLFYCRGRDQVSTGCATLLREPDREVVDRAAPFAFADSSNFLPRWLCSLLLSGTSAWPFPGCRDLRACW